MHGCFPKFNSTADVIQLHSPRSETSQQQQQQQQQENEPLVMEEASHHVDDNPEKL